MAVALMAASLVTSAADARKAGEPAGQTGRTSLRVNAEAVPASLDVERKDGRVVGMTAVKKDGSRVALKAQSKPTCATSCPAGKTLSCWEDEAQLMSVCVCTSAGTSAGEIGVASVFTATTW